MSSDFVRYSPDIETFDPKLSEYMTRIIEFWEKKVRESPVTEGSGRAVRGAHAKTLGVVRAEVEMLGTAPAPYAQGIYAQPGRHDALIRDQGMAGEAVSVRDRRASARPAPGHLGISELREGRRAGLQPVARDVRSPAAGRDHGCAPRLHGFSQNAPDPESPAAGRARRRRRCAGLAGERRGLMAGLDYDLVIIGSGFGGSGPPGPAAGPRR